MNIYNKLAVLARATKGQTYTPHNAAFCADGGQLCGQCVIDNYRLVLRMTRDNVGTAGSDIKQWAIVDTGEAVGQCDNCYKIIGEEG